MARGSVSTLRWWALRLMMRAVDVAGLDCCCEEEKKWCAAVAVDDLWWAMTTTAAAQRRILLWRRREEPLSSLRWVVVVVVSAASSSSSWLFYLVVVVWEVCNSGRLFLRIRRKGSHFWCSSTHKNQNQLVMSRYGGRSEDAHLIFIYSRFEMSTSQISRQGLSAAPEG